MKKILSLLLSMIIMLTFTVFPAFAAGFDSYLTATVNPDGVANATEGDSVIPSTEKYTNGLYFQGVQVRKTAPTGLRFVFARSLELEEAINNEIANANFEVRYLVGLKANTEGGVLEVGKAPVDRAVESIYRTSKNLSIDGQPAEEYEKFTVCITGLDAETYFNVGICVRPYIVYTDASGQEHILYGEQSNCSLYDAAKGIYDESTDEEDKQWLYENILSIIVGDNDESADDVFGTQPEVSYATLMQYPTYPDELPRDYDYEVSVTNGKDTINLPVYNASRQINAYHSVEDTDSYRRFCEFGFDKGEVTVSVKVKKEMTSYAILPSSKGIDSTYKNGVITFKLSQPEDILIRLNDDPNTILSIFAQPIDEETPKETDANTVYFKAGLNNISSASPVSFSIGENGAFTIPSGYTVYLEPGALVTTRLTIQRGATDVKITGRGAFIDPRLDRGEDPYNLAYMLYGYDVTDVNVENVKFLDAHCFNLCFCRVDGLNVNNVKILSSEISTDGFSFWGSPENSNKNILIENCFMYNNDNSVIVTSSEGLTVRDCTFGTKHAIFVTNSEVLDFNMENIDVFRVGDIFKSINPSSITDHTWNVTGKNIRAEDAGSANLFVNINGQEDGVKNILFENVSLPNFTATNDIFVNNTTNVNITLNNVYINNGTPVISENDLVKQGMQNSTLTISGENNATLAGTGIYAAAVKTASYSGAPTIKVGGYTVPFDAKGALDVEGYIPANNVLNALRNTTSTSGYTKVVDGVTMISLDFFRNVLGMTVTVNADGVVMSAPDVEGVNLLRDPGFENIVSPISNTLPYTRNWTMFNLAQLSLSTTKNSGTHSMRVSYKAATGDRGAAQYIGDIIKIYGAGTYTFKAYVRRADTNAWYEAKIGLAESKYDLTGAKTDVKLIGGTYSDKFIEITHTVTITDPTAEGYDRAFFFLGSTNSATALDFYFDDAALYFSK